MNENIDLTKILEGCPKGTKFYSSVYGTVEFIEIDFINESKHPINLETIHGCCRSTKDGKALSEYDGECILFPSKDQRDWSKFERFWDKPKTEKFDPKTLQPFDKVLVRDNQKEKWWCDFFAFMENGKRFPVMCAGIIYQTCIPYNDDTKHLVGTKDDCPEYYKWWKE